MSIEEMKRRLEAIAAERKTIHDTAGEAALDEAQTKRWADLDDEETELKSKVAEAETAEREAKDETERLERVAESRKVFTTARAQVTSEPETYRKGGKNSYFRDLMRAQLSGSRDSMERLNRNDREVSESRALSTTDGGVGEFVPPLWMVQDYVKLARAARVIANRVRPMALPPGTDSVSLPRLATGTAVAEQATQNTAVSETDATSNSVTAAVATIAGQQTLAQQLIDQSPINMDEVILLDLAADYAVKLDTFVISNNAANKRGLRFVSGINAVTYTDATPTVPEFYLKLGDAIQQIHTSRFMAADHIFMHPRRWAWVTSVSDTTGRPLAVPAAQAPQNVIAQVGTVAAEGFVGTMQGLPVFVDANIPATVGAGTEDVVIVAKADDVILFEGTPRAEAFRETKAAELSVLLRFFNYAALQSERYPKSISVISGTGLIAPTF